VQLAAATRATVVATVRNEELRAVVAALGAEAVAPDAFVDHGPFDVILELVGAPNVPAHLDALATGGRISIIGVGGGADIELPLLVLMQKRASIRGSTLRTRPLEQKALAAQLVERHVLPLVDNGAVTVPVEATYPMADAAAAYERFAAGGKFGKIVLVI
jgi:NADPH:quinone reductase-like Zn-dependent oxidoreductase